MYEVPLTDVTSVETIGENYVEVMFHIDNTILQFHQQGLFQMEILTSMKLGIPNTSTQFCARANSTPAMIVIHQTFKEWLNSV
ncbi:hypothetical protein Tco_0409477 [Tanacetum coccineum]